MTATAAVPSFLAPPAGWVLRGRSFFSSADGRFDVFLAESTGMWVAVDHDVGVKGRIVLRPVKKAHFATVGEAVMWCQNGAEVSR